MSGTQQKDTMHQQVPLQNQDQKNKKQHKESRTQPGQKKGREDGNY